MNTVDSILKAFEDMAERKVSLDPHQYLEGTAKLLALIGNEQDKYYELEHKLAIIRSMEMDKWGNASKARITAEATQEYLEARKLKAKIDRVFEAIKIGKLMARMSQEQYKSG